jgi:hypothetical protein
MSRESAEAWPLQPSPLSLRPSERRPRPSGRDGSLSRSSRRSLTSCRRPAPPGLVRQRCSKCRAACRDAGHRSIPMAAAGARRTAPCGPARHHSVDAVRSRRRPASALRRLPAGGGPSDHPTRPGAAMRRQCQAALRVASTATRLARVTVDPRPSTFLASHASPLRRALPPLRTPTSPRRRKLHFNAWRRSHPKDGRAAGRGLSPRRARTHSDECSGRRVGCDR